MKEHWTDQEDDRAEDTQSSATCSFIEDVLPRAKSDDTVFGWIGNAWDQNISKR